SYPIVGGRAAGSREFADIHGELAAGNTTTWSADVQQEGNVYILGGPPEVFVDGMTVGPVGEGRDGDEGTDQSQPGAAFQFLAGVVHIVHIQHGDTLETIGIRLAEIGDPVVIDPADGREQLAVRDAVPEQALTRLQASAPHTVHF